RKLTKMTKRYWLIQGYDTPTTPGGKSKIFEQKVGIGQLSRKQVQALLMALVAKAGLNYDEIVGAYATRGTRIAHDHLVVKRDGPDSFWCSAGPCFTAKMVVAEVSTEDA